MKVHIEVFWALTVGVGRVTREWSIEQIMNKVQLFVHLLWTYVTSIDPSMVGMLS